MSRDFDGVRVGIYSVSRLCPEDNVSGLSVDSVSELRLGDSVSELRSGIMSRNYVQGIMSRDYAHVIASRNLVRG